MKAFRRILKLLPPAFLMRRWLDRRYKIKVPPAPGGVVAGFFLAILPYAFTAALSVRVASDCRLLKYFLPYGKMKRFVRMTYGMQRGDETRDQGLVGAVRAIMPYGLVLWWDAEDARLSVQTGKAKPARQIYGGQRLSEKERQEFVRMDRVEATALRSLIMMTGKPRRDIPRRDIPCGKTPSFEEVFFETPAGNAWDKWRLMDGRPLVVDMIFSVGGDCIAASQQKARNLRPYSLPFDWCFSDGEGALSRFASMLENGFRDFALRENLQAIPDVRFGYKDVKSGYSFIHHFKASIETPGEYARFNETLRRRIGRFYREIERSHAVLCLLSRSWKLKDSCLDPLKSVLKKKWPDKKFYYAIVTYNSIPPQIETKDDALVVRIPRNRTAYDLNEKVFEWSFLDNVRFSENSVDHFKSMRDNSRQ